jgi:hypothetical protein
MDRTEIRQTIYIPSALIVNSIFRQAPDNEKRVMIAEYPGYRRFPRNLRKRAHRIGLSEHHYQALLIRVGMKIDGAF